MAIPKIKNPRLRHEYKRLHKREWQHSPASAKEETAASMLRRIRRAKENINIIDTTMKKSKPKKRKKR